MRQRFGEPQQRVGVYLEELADPQTGERDLGDFLERRKLVEKLSRKLRPDLICQLVSESLDEDESRDFIEEWVDHEVGLEEE